MQAPEGYLRQLTEGGQLPCNSKKKKKKKNLPGQQAFCAVE